MKRPSDGAKRAAKGGRSAERTAERAGVRILGAETLENEGLGVRGVVGSGGEPAKSCHHFCDCESRGGG